MNHLDAVATNVQHFGFAHGAFAKNRARTHVGGVPDKKALSSCLGLALRLLLLARYLLPPQIGRILVDVFGLLLKGQQGGVAALQRLAGTH